MWPRVHRHVRTWPAPMFVGLMMVAAAAMSVWRAAPAPRTHSWTHKLTSVSPGEWQAHVWEGWGVKLGSALEGGAPLTLTQALLGEVSSSSFTGPPPSCKAD